MLHQGIITVLGRIYIPLSPILTLGENCLIGAGAVVIKDVPTNAVMAGIPAKVLKYRE